MAIELENIDTETLKQELFKRETRHMREKRQMVVAEGETKYGYYSIYGLDDDLKDLETGDCTIMESDMISLWNTIDRDRFIPEGSKFLKISMGNGGSYWCFIHAGSKLVVNNDWAMRNLCNFKEVSYPYTELALQFRSPNSRDHMNNEE